MTYSMNLRQYKKRAKRAREILVTYYGVKDSEFWSPPKGDKDQELVTSQPVDTAERGWIKWQCGTPAWYPAPVDYWGEANDPVCCIDFLDELVWWDTCGDSYIRKELNKEERVPNV